MRSRFLSFRTAALAALACLLAASGPAFAQDEDGPIPRLLKNRQRAELQSAARLGTNAPAGQDTVWVGHSLGTPNSGAPWFIGTGPRRPLVNNNGAWDWDHFNVGENDSLQGWWPIRLAYTSTGGLTLPDKDRPWWAIDIGNQANYVLNSRQQNRTFGVNGVWHVDGGSLVPSSGDPGGNPAWAPLAGTGSAWCGLRAPDDRSTRDSVARGGYGNAFNSELLGYNGETSQSPMGTSKNFPGYGSQWDQMLYRDVRVANGGALSVTFKFRTRMSTGRDLSAATRTGWFDKDPTSLLAGNFISSTEAGAAAPVDSFMVYVGVPANPTSYRRADGVTNPIYDLKRRWFSEVLTIEAPYVEVASLWGDSTGQMTAALPNAVIQPMLDHARNGGTGDGGGILRVVFRSKTNRGFDDMGTALTGYSSGTEGAVRIDDVVIAGGAGGTVTSGFETAGEIDNVIEAPNGTAPGPAVGQGYALNTWHATGKPPAVYLHAHPLMGGDIGGGNYYTPLAYNDLCGPPDSPKRHCNIDGVIISVGDHDRGEASGGPLGTATQEVKSGLISPSICLTGFTIPTGDGRLVNGIGLDADDVDATNDYYIWCDIYMGIYNLNFNGNGAFWGAQCWPARQANGALGWGEIRFPTYMYWDPEPRCEVLLDCMGCNGLIVTSNESGIPDSLRVLVGNVQQCFRFAVTLGCSPREGGYYDNVSVGFVDAGPPLATRSAAALGSASINGWNLYNDAFPANESPGFPGTAAFDTMAILVKTGLNTAQSTGNMQRFDIPGDTVVVQAANAGMRLDMVFRILPGPGDYVVAGNKASGLRKVPTSPAAATPGDGSFWGEYLASADGGSGFGTPGGHPGGVWSNLVWNSARCDTAEKNYFPVAAKGNLPGINTSLGLWAGMYHESDPKYATLGIVKNRCFLVDTAGAVNGTNTTCGPGGVGGAYPPAWITTVPPSRTGYPGTPTTIEYTKIIPDGILTPGAHVQYFFRKSAIASPAVFYMAPDTNYALPQPDADWSWDGQRWQQFAALPDRWKDVPYGGIGSACMLFVDWLDSAGDELVWVGAADSIGATAANKYGAHNGWHVDASYVAPDGSHNFWGQVVAGTPAAVCDKNAQPGTTWDMFGVKANYSLTSAAGTLGSRLANRANMGYATGKESKQGPTPDMLRTYYKILLNLTSLWSTGSLGPYVNRSQNDVLILEDFMAGSANPYDPRGVMVQGNGFVQGETQMGGIDPAHLALLTNYFGVSLRDAAYRSISGNQNEQVDLLPTSLLSPGGDVMGVANGCLWSNNDVLTVNTVLPGATATSYYENVGANGPYVAGVYVPSSASHPYITLVDGFDIWDLNSRFGENSIGRLAYLIDVFTNVFGSICAVNGAPSVDIPNNTTGPRLVDYVGNVRNNPLVTGAATVRFGLARRDRVQVEVYDVAGRKVRTLADREFQAGEHALTWDGTGDDGQRLARGVYFTQLRYVNSRFVDARKVTVLK